MASRVIYPPIVDSYMPAFKAGSGSCKVYFSLSKFNSSSDFTSVHISVVKQGTGMNVVKKSDSNNKYRSTGIILNAKPVAVEGNDNLYYVEIENDDLSSTAGSYSGWIPGWIYKIQIRLSALDYDGSVGQAAWLNNNASYFSEWSTVCIVKAIGQIYYTIPMLNINTEQSSVNSNSTNTLYISTLDLSGHFTRSEDPSELINTCQFILYDSNDNIIDNSGDIYMNQYQDNDSFNYLSRTELEDGKTYKLAFKYETINHYVDGFYRFEDDIDDRYEFVVSQISIDPLNCIIITADSDTEGVLTDITSVEEEEDEGRMGLKLYSTDDSPYSGNICIRRADSRTNFKVWDDIKIIVLKEKSINNVPIVYDYTIESGVWYKYGVQPIDKNGTRGLLIQSSAVMRNFEYSYLLGKDNQQLKLMFDNTMSNFKYQIVESKVDPIGSKYPIVTRNAETRYRTFPINGLISFWMDENKLFCDKKVVYEHDDVVDLYNNYNTKNNIAQYDYIYERDFRQKVLDFLYDGEVKLFKSPTEGNIVVRLTDINCVPNQSLDRMIYSFSCNAHEMMEPSMQNYLNVGFYAPGEYGVDFSVYSVRLGQIQDNFKVGDNIFQKILEKYDSQGKNFAGYTKRLQKIHHLKITFEDKPLRIANSNSELVSGYNFRLNGSNFTVYSPMTEYEFDSNLTYDPRNDSLFLLGDAQGTKKTISATIDFLYELQSETFEDKQIQLQEIKQGTGQLFDNFAANDNLYNILNYKYYIEWETQFRRLRRINSIEIEANPGVIIEIKDEADSAYEQHEINETGQLRFTDIARITGIRYAGIRDDDAEDGINKDVRADILMNYDYTLLSGTYKET